MNIIERLKEKYPNMTKKQKQIAEYMMNHVDKMSFITLKELSAETNVTEMTILNACAAFGYANFNEVKYEFRNYISMLNKIELHQENEYPSTFIPKYELEDQKKVLTEILEEEAGMFQRFVENTDIEKLFRISHEIVSSEKIIICGRGVSKLMAEFFTLRLASIGIGAIIVDTELNDSLHAALAMIDDKTLLIPISLPDYYFMTDKVAAYAKGCKAKILVLTDNDQAPIVQFSDWALYAPSATRLFLNTPSVVTALINILTSAVEIEMSFKENSRASEVMFTELFK